MFMNALMLKRREKERKRGKGGIIRLNDKKEQCCDSEQLVFPSVDRRCICVFVCMYVCACALDGDRLSCDCSFLSGALLIGVIDSICREKKNMTNGTQPNVPLHFPPQDILY